LYKTFLRVILATLFTMQLKKELYTATKMLTYLKQMKYVKKNQKGRLINIILASMQILGPMMSMTSLIISMTQESQLSQIIKSFVALSFVVGIDDMFVGSLPRDLRDNVESMNESKALQLSKDYNSNALVLARIK
jgi:hypothetical protein